MTTITFDIHHFTPEVQDFLFKLHNAIQDSIKVSKNPSYGATGMRGQPDHRTGMSGTSVNFPLEKK
jgi:hypothetical protein